jgi:Domain of unknown function (DUF4832)/Domain of unknown function (DUF4874)
MQLMFSTSKFSFLVLALMFCFACKESKTITQENQEFSTVTYTEEQSNFANPERGYYGQLESGSAALDPLTKATLDQLKAKNITMIRRLYSMTSFRVTPISTSFLDHVQKDMDMIRSNGFKIILRFAYTFNEPAPWNDAPESLILSHIDQLKPILQKNVDVIAMMEAGFIGRWGEWHTSSNKLDKTPTQKSILFKVLDALPKSRFVLLRTQQQKINIFDKKEPISDAEAFNQSNFSRTGHHNDCFLASEDDWGTYWPNDATSLTEQKKYLNQENKFVPQEGETCNCNSPRSDCSSALKELVNMRWSSLNKDYIACVLDSWVAQGCYTDIAKKLGYRFRLISSVIPKTANIGESFNLKIVLKNEGFASPYNAHGAELIFRSKTNGSIFKVNLDQDIRKWLPDLNEIKLDLKLKLPAQISAGEYEILLNFPDPEKTLNTNPAYSIRLANQSVWEAVTGFNSLLVGVVVK